MDRIEKGLAEDARIRVTAVDVTVAAKALEARHLSGPAASQVLGEALAAVALLGADAATPDEAVTLRLDVDGPIGGVLVEAHGNGHLRGYTRVKVLDALDASADYAATGALGASGSMHVLVSRPGKLLSHAAIPLPNPSLQTAVARYCNQSRQVPTGAVLAVRTDSGGLIHARGLIAERMPDSRTEAFVGVLEAMESGAVASALHRSVALPTLAEALTLTALTARETRPLQFACECSAEKIRVVAEAMPIDELDALIARGTPANVYCHMCGNAHSLSVSLLQAIRAAKAAEAEPGNWNERGTSPIYRTQ